MENTESLNALMLSLKNYYIYVHECNEMWIQASQKACEKERDLLVLSEQLRCLSGQNKTKLSALEVQKTADRITLIIEENYTYLSAAVESAISTQDELTNLRRTAEMHCELLNNNNIVQRIIKNIYVAWLFFQMRSSSVSIALKKVSFKSPKSIKEMIQCVSQSDKFRSELTETLEIAENLMRNLELCP